MTPGNRWRPSISLPDISPFYLPSRSGPCDTAEKIFQFPHGRGPTLPSAKPSVQQHSYIIGATRSDKTNYMLSQLEGAFAFIDKHGDAARQIADSMPCLYWRPADLNHIVAFNPLQGVHPDQRWKVTADIVSIFSDIWKLGPETPRLLYYLRAALRLLLDTSNTTLLDVPRVLTDDSYRNGLLRACGDPETRQTWTEFSGKKEQQQAQEIGSLRNKIAARNVRTSLLRLF
jgi:hypothetical protein